MVNFPTVIFFGNLVPIPWQISKETALKHVLYETGNSKKEAMRRDKHLEGLGAGLTTLVPARKWCL